MQTQVGASYFESQNNSSSKTSVSYSEKKTVQHSKSQMERSQHFRIKNTFAIFLASTQVSQRIESSSSTQLSSMNYLEALKEPNSYSIITSSSKWMNVLVHIYTTKALTL